MDHRLTALLDRLQTARLPSSSLTSSPMYVSRNWSSVASKLEKIASGGRSKLHLISDFDMTLTKYWVNGARNLSSHAVLTQSSSIPQWFKDDTDVLFKKYYPIEINKVMSEEEKVPKMIEWWSQAHDLIMKLRLRSDDLDTIVSHAKIIFRPGADTFITLSNEKEIPLLVFSAGIGNVIESVLKQHNLAFPNVRVVSNRMLFDPETNVNTAFSEPIIHIFNKNEFTALVHPVKTSHHDSHTESVRNVSSETAATSDESILSRPNVMLLGDSLGDIRMAEGVPHEVLFSVGFLNHDWDDEKLREKYCNTFDLVVLGDADMSDLCAFITQL